MPDVNEAGITVPLVKDAPYVASVNFLSGATLTLNMTGEALEALLASKKEGAQFMFHGHWLDMKHCCFIQYALKRDLPEVPGSSLTLLPEESN